MTVWTVLSNGSNMNIRSKTRIAILCMSAVTILFVLHEIISNTMLMQNTGGGLLKMLRRPNLDLNVKTQMDQESEQKISKFLNDRGSFSIAPQLTEPFSGERLVHLDLKGAPPIVSYFKELFPYLKKVGATGLLLEYEDMLPYFNTIKDITAYNAYSNSDIQTILNLAESNGLTVIPLIQTFGHLEFVLKLENYRELREVDRYPLVVCPSHEKTIPFLQKMIDQVISLHPKSKYIHIGGDEVFYIGKCDKCSKVMMENEWTKYELFLNHIRAVTKYIKKAYPDVRPIVWDDEFRVISEDLIKEFAIPNLTDIMVWKYTPDVQTYITSDILDKYSRLFGSVWIASAFKGATGVDQMVTDVKYHLANHVAWMEVVSRWKSHINFKGIALTGWQRYDHFSVLCELLPVGLPSLTVDLQYLSGVEGGIQQNGMTNVLQCDFPLAMSPSELSLMMHAVNKCNFPGSGVYHLVAKLYLLTNEIQRFLKDNLHGWFSSYNILQRFSSPGHVQRLTENIDHYQMELLFIEENLRKAMSEVYDDHTTDEWILSYLTPLQLRIEALVDAREALLSQNTWPRRPFPNDINVVRKVFLDFCNTTNYLECGLINL